MVTPLRFTTLASKFEDGTVFDTSADRDPLEFTIGRGQLIPGFEQAVIGMSPGESKTVNIPAGEAYGQHNAEMLTEVDRSQFPDDLNPEVGQQLQLNRPDGQTVVVTVASVSESTVTLDANHPLAGKDLIFDIQLVAIL
jgi:FKBP-type peptidyl-prolyl cis-trans isomerase 2